MEAFQVDGRSRSPAETYALVEPHLSRLGISRVARQTGLDRVGLPCFAAIRPNSRSLAAHYGKGLTDDAARVAAVMEAVEFAIAEEPSVRKRVATANDLVGDGHDIFDCRSLLPPGLGLDPELELIWVEGERLATGGPIFVPADAITLGDLLPRLTDIAKTTNGLASGNNRDEAVLHGLCELIERDALTIWSLQNEDFAAKSGFRPEDLANRTVDALQRQLEAAGLGLRLFDLTTNIGVPVVHAMVGEPSSLPARLFDVAAGTCCHPETARATISAIAEAIQSRLTNIAGSRDDFSASEYAEELPPELQALVMGAHGPALPPRGLPPGRSTRELIAHVVSQLAACGIEDMVVVPLSGEDLDVSVIRVLSGQLEDCLGNANWWPQVRALGAAVGGYAR
jgi:YcaO-like protein with predicted kinase domain